MRWRIASCAVARIRPTALQTSPEHAFEAPGDVGLRFSESRFRSHALACAHLAQ